MKYLKLGLISFVFFFLLLSLISTLLPSSVNIIRSVDINAPVNSVYSRINNLANWKNWYAGYDASGASLSANPVGKGATIHVNNTTITILEASATQILALWQPGNASPFSGEFNFMKSQVDSTFTLQWRFNYRVKWYPWDKFSSVFSDKAIGPFMEKSLSNLKQEVEKL